MHMSNAQSVRSDWIISSRSSQIYSMLHAIHGGPRPLLPDESFL